MGTESRECRRCHRIGYLQFVPVSGDNHTWECANDRACSRRQAARGRCPVATDELAELLRTCPGLNVEHGSALAARLRSPEGRAVVARALRLSTGFEWQMLDEKPLTSAQMIQWHAPKTWHEIELYWAERTGDEGEH